jgi:hypothetical protein
MLDSQIIWGVQHQVEPCGDRNAKKVQVFGAAVPLIDKKSCRNSLEAFGR